MIWGKEISLQELILILAFIGLYFIFFNKVRNIARRLGSSMNAFFFKFALRSLYFALFLAALLGPSFGITEIEQKAAGKDIIYAVDLSKSMDATDIVPSRLEKAKLIITSLVENLPSNRTGIIVFSNDAYVQIPLTFDEEVISFAVQNLSTQLLNEGGTNIESAIEVASQRFQENNGREKTLIIITDGEDFGQETYKLEDAKTFNIIVIGIGTETGADITVGNKIYHTSANQQQLTKLSQSLNAEVFFDDDRGNITNDILLYLQELRDKMTDPLSISVENNKYRYFLLPALLLLAIDIVFIVKIFKL